MKWEKFVNTFGRERGSIINVNPPIHYKVFVSPHKQKYLLQKDSNGSCPFFLHLFPIKGCI